LSAITAASGSRMLSSRRRRSETEAAVVMRAA
jgi:hypothetical protein